MSGSDGVDDSRLVDLIYESVVVPDLWPSVLQAFAQAADSDWAALLTRRSDAWLGWRISPNAAQTVDTYLRSEAATRSQTTARLLAYDRQGFVADHELFAEADYLADSYMADWGTASGFHHGAATGILAPTGDMAVVQVMRRRGEPRYSATELAQLDRLRPHFARAAILAARWRMERLRAAAQALALVGLPVAILDADCRVAAANDLIEGLGGLVWLPRNAIAFSDRAASATLRQAAAAAVRHGGVAGRSFPVRAHETADALIAHVIPLRGEGRDVFDGDYAILAITAVGDDRPVDSALIQGLFDLTAAESQIAAGVARGWSIDAIARHNGVGRETVRTQLRSVLSKTGASRQAELAAKLGGLRRPF
jgi:DNA-binding CsgD family transcriptional regulator